MRSVERDYRLASNGWLREAGGLVPIDVGDGERVSRIDYPKELERIYPADVSVSFYIDAGPVFPTSKFNRNTLAARDAILKIVERGSEMVAVLGPMWSAKTAIAYLVASGYENEERRVQVFQHGNGEERAGKRTLAIKDRNGGMWDSHLETQSVRSFSEVIERTELCSRGLLLVDEFMFFPDVDEDSLARFDERLRSQAMSAVYFGLDTTFSKTLWEASEVLIRQAGKVVVVTAECDCVDCRNPAFFTMREVTVGGVTRPACINDPIVVVGGSDCYRPACSEHHGLFTPIQAEEFEASGETDWRVWVEAQGENRNDRK